MNREELLTCKIDGEAFKNDKELHAHLRTHKIRIVEYYQKYYPQKDKFTGEMIKFKTKKQYFSSDFNNRTNLKRWLKDQIIVDAKEYCKNLLVSRKEKKELIYSPCQVELRSLIMPPVQYYDELFGDYYRLCDSLEYKNKFNKFNEIVSGNEYNKPEYKIYIDSREQKPLKFEKRLVEVQALKFGDYAFSSQIASCNCNIERKSLSDFIGTMSGGYERFINEIKRAKEANAYLVVLVEEKFNNALGFKFLPHISKKIKATPEFIFHRVRNICQKYEHVQFLFVNGRKEASRVIERIFTSGCSHKKIDLQFAYDKRKL